MAIVKQIFNIVNDSVKDALGNTNGITQVDSIKWSTIFERFCNEQRVTPADIDVDFETARRPEVQSYIVNKYKGNFIWMIIYSHR